jgi:hypothetical protein
MALGHSSKIVTSGLIFYYDMGNTPKSWKGVPTTNVQANQELFVYNNVTAHVTATIVDTGGYFQGAKIYKQTLTPTTATGVSYLTAGNNPGIGVRTSNGGGTANTYTGYSIYFKLGVPGHTSPIFTHYSNVAGYQSSTNYDYIGDGWYRGHVIWYDTVTRSDSKYWAINPASATLNVPIVVYWCAPFRENRNDSTFVAPFVNGTRSATDNLVDLSNRSTITSNNLTYNSDNTFNFTPASGGTVRVPLSTALNKLEGSIDMWIYPQGYNGGNGYFVNRTGQTPNALDWLWAGPYGNTFYFRLGDGVGCCNLDLTVSSWSTRAPLNTWRHVCFTWKSANTSAIYVNGELVTSRSITTIPSTSPDTVGEIGNGHAYNDGSFNGKIPAVKIYDRQLTASEVKQNFAALRGRYGI